MESGFRLWTRMMFAILPRLPAMRLKASVSSPYASSSGMTSIQATCHLPRAKLRVGWDWDRLPVGQLYTCGSVHRGRGSWRGRSRRADRRGIRATFVVLVALVRPAASLPHVPLLAFELPAQPGALRAMERDGPEQRPGGPFSSTACSPGEAGSGRSSNRRGFPPSPPVMPQNKVLPKG